MPRYEAQQWRKMFQICDPVSEGKATLIAVDEKPDHQIVPPFRLGKANRTMHSPLHTGPRIEVFALDFLRVLLAHFEVYPFVKTKIDLE